MKFYVYILYRPWDMSPCYVGKGKGDRLKQHYRFGKNHANKHLGSIFDKAGGELPHRIVFETNDEQQAHLEEIRLIKLYGRADKNQGSLCNWTDGGEGICGYKFSAESRLQKSESMKAWYRAPANKSKHQAAMKKAAESSQAREKLSKTSREAWKNPETRIKQQQATKAALSKPEIIAKMSASQKARRIRERLERGIT